MPALQVSAAEHNILVVIGEAKHFAVAPHDAPAARERGDAGIELGLQRGRDGAHAVDSVMLGIGLGGSGETAFRRGGGLLSYFVVAW